VTRPTSLIPDQPAAPGRPVARPDSLLDRPGGVRDHLAAVDALLGQTMDTLTRHWSDLAGGQPPDVLGDADLPQLLLALLGSGG
jgi:hypothetical protein